MNDQCSIAGLPLIPFLSARPANFDLCNLLALMLSEIEEGNVVKEEGNVVKKAQRSYAENFNRLDSSAISRKRRKLQHGGWVKRVRKTHRLIPDIYAKGPRLERDRSLDSEWKAVSVALYGVDGLFADLLGSPAWGHQCLNPGAIATLAVLQKATESVTLPEIIQYFSPICSASTIRTGVKKLKNLGIVRDVSGVLVLSEDWSERLGQYFSENPCCLDRSIKGRQMRAIERETIRLQVTSGALSPAEKGQLRALPCVRCGGKASQQEHFPPKRFLKDLSNQNGRNVVSAICVECNEVTRSFIQSMPFLRPQKKTVVFGPNVDPWEIYRARTNMLMLEWYAAIERNDYVIAVGAVQRALDLYAAVLNQQMDVASQRKIGKVRRKSTRQSGKNHKLKRTPSSSQLGE